MLHVQRRHDLGFLAVKFYSKAYEALLLYTCNVVFQMPGGGVTVKDVNQQEFVRALAAFLKK